MVGGSSGEENEVLSGQRCVRMYVCVYESVYVCVFRNVGWMCV